MSPCPHPEEISHGLGSAAVIMVVFLLTLFLCRVSAVADTGVRYSVCNSTLHCQRGYRAPQIFQELIGVSYSSLSKVNS